MADMVRGALVPVHPDGRRFVAGAVALALVGWRWRPVRCLGLALAGAMAFFFRNPARVPPTGRTDVVVAPADGEICAVDLAVPPVEAGLGAQERRRISIFLSLTDVHVQRAPVAGRVMGIAHTAGTFVSADLPEASDHNERTVLVLRTPAGADVACVQVAGMIARRIVTQTAVGDDLALGQTYGLIRFGSRVDLYLPAGVAVDVQVGQRTIGGETVLGRLS
ncbi:MAG: phosphatidylserine decarboxylase [Propionibacteriaceae bacterium]|nr:phosphatidylserine decarboxylase [Propionibacteriaceae bacterium]